MFFKFGNKNREIDKIKTQDMKAAKGKDIVAKVYPKVKKDATQEKYKSKFDEELTERTMAGMYVGDLYCRWQKVMNEYFPFPKPILDNTRIEVIAQKEGTFENYAVMDLFEPVIVNLYLKDPATGIERCVALPGEAAEFISNAADYIYGSPREIADGEEESVGYRFDDTYFFSPYGVWKAIVDTVPYKVNYASEIDYLRQNDLLGCDKNIIEDELAKYNRHVQIFDAVWTTIFPPGKENEFLNEIIDEINTIKNDMAGELWNYDHPSDSREFNCGYRTRRRDFLTEKHWFEPLDEKRVFPEVEEYLK